MAIELNLKSPNMEIAEKEASSGALSVYEHAPDSVNFKKLRKRLIRQVRQVVDGYGLIHHKSSGEKPKWLVCLSGGKDSYGLLVLLMDLQHRGLLPVDLLACNLDQVQPGFPKHILPDYLTRHHILHRIETEDTYSIVVDKVPENRTYCSLCSRLRRGILYRIAREEKCDAIVLGHHREDVLETFFLNMFHGGKLTAMPPKLRNEEGDLHVLRPLVFSAENDLQKFSDGLQFPIIPCTLCGSQDGMQRQNIKAMLESWERQHPGRKEVMLKAMTNTNPSHLLDGNIFDFFGV